MTLQTRLSKLEATAPPDDKRPWLRVIGYSPPSRHDPTPHFANRKTRNPPSNHQFHDAGFMESIV
jgi:hypothetical protein